MTFVTFQRSISHLSGESTILYSFISREEIHNYARVCVCYNQLCYTVLYSLHFSPTLLHLFLRGESKLYIMQRHVP